MFLFYSLIPPHTRPLLLIDILLLSHLSCVFAIVYFSSLLLLFALYCIYLHIWSSK